MKRWVWVLASSLAWLGVLQPPVAGAEVDDVVVGGQAWNPTRAASVPWLISVWDFAEADGVVYVVGQFTDVRRWSGDGWAEQSYAAAFDAVTGRPISSFAPELNGPAFSVAVSGDGTSVYIGGEFTRVNGRPRTGLVAVDPETGATQTAFAATVAGTARPSVHDIEVVGNQVYVAGSFASVNTNGQSTTRRRVARLWAGSGQPDGFRPMVYGGRVYDIAVSPDRTRAYLGGAFRLVNGDSEASFFAGVSTSGAGELLDGFSQGIDRTNLPRLQTPFVFAVAATDDVVWWGGESHLLTQVDANTGARRRAYFATWWDNNNRGGDSQSLEIVGDRIYSGGHAYGMMVDLHNDARCAGATSWLAGCRDRFPRNQWIDIRGTWIQAFDVNTAAHIPSFRPNTAGRSGVWALHWSESTNSLWFGGDISHNNLQAARGFGVLRESSAADVAIRSTAQTRERIVLNWSRPAQGTVAHYEVQRDGGPTVERPGRWYTDRNLAAGTRYEYRVRPIYANGSAGTWTPWLAISTQG